MSAARQSASMASRSAAREVYLVSVLDLGQLGLVSFGQGMPGIDQAQAPVRRVWGLLLGHRGGRHSLGDRCGVGVRRDLLGEAEPDQSDRKSGQQPQGKENAVLLHGIFTSQFVRKRYQGAPSNTPHFDIKTASDAGTIERKDKEIPFFLGRVGHGGLTGSQTQVDLLPLLIGKRQEIAGGG